MSSADAMYGLSAGPSVLKSLYDVITLRVASGDSAAVGVAVHIYTYIYHYTLIQELLINC